MRVASNWKARFTSGRSTCNIRSFSAAMSPGSVSV
jgi:hypothetical protein